MNKDEMIEFLQKQLEHNNNQLNYANQQLEKSQQQNKELLFKMDKIQAQLDKLLRQLYGRKSEKSPKSNNRTSTNKDDDNNPSSGDGISNNSKLHKIDKEIPQKPKRKKPPEHLFRETIYHDLSEEQKFCTTCKQVKSLVGTDTSEQFEFIPAKLFVKEHVKYTYSCSCCITTVPMPEQPIIGGLAGPGLLTDIIISKYDDSMPLYRQNQRFKRQDNVDIPESTLCDWVAKAAFWLEPIVEVMKNDAMRSIKIHSDDTTVPVLAKGKTKTGRLWVYLADGAGIDGVIYNIPNVDKDKYSNVNTNKCTIYEYTPTRHAKWPLNFLTGFSGFLQVDAYSGYNEVITQENITEIDCIAHGRRYFIDVAKAAKGESIAHDALEQIGRLYHVEHCCKDMTAFQRYRYRKKYSKPILKKLHRWLKSTIKTLVPNTPISKAVNYMLNHWRGFCNYLSNGYLDIDNNKAERAMRRVAIGRKNWMFAGSDEGGKRAAIIYSILETCKQNGINTFDYLKDVLTRLPSSKQSEIKNLTPYNWQPA